MTGVRAGLAAPVNVLGGNIALMMHHDRMALRAIEGNRTLDQQCIRILSVGIGILVKRLERDERRRRAAWTT